MRKGRSVKGIVLPVVALLVVLSVVLSGCAAPAAAPAPAPAPKSQPAPQAQATPVAPAAAEPAKSAPAAPPTAKPAAAPAQASKPPYFQGKTMTIIIPYAAGGTVDFLARLAAKIMPKYLAGNPTMVPQNMPGGGGNIGARAVYDAKPDGLTITHFPSMKIMDQFLGVEKEMDFTKFIWLGAPAGSSFVLDIRADAGIKTIDDLRNTKKTLRMGGLGKGTGVDDFILLMNEMMGLNMKVVGGYKTTPEIYLAIKQKELDGMASYTGAHSFFPMAKEMFESGEMIVPFYFGGQPMGDFWEKKMGKIPYIADYLKPDDRKAYEAFANLLYVFRPFAVTPGTPSEIVQELRDAAWKTFNDPEYAQEAAKLGVDLYPAKPEKIEQYMKELLALPDPLKAKLAAAFK